MKVLKTEVDPKYDVKYEELFHGAGTSFTLQKLMMNHLVSKCLDLKPGAKVLDIALCRGEVGYYLKSEKYCNRKDIHLTGVDIYEYYIKGGSLKIYDEIIISDVRDLSDEFFKQFDLIVFMDCIEHIPGPAGVTLLNRLIESGAPLIMCTPHYRMLQHNIREDDHEEHVSFWNTAKLLESNPAYFGWGENGEALYCWDSWIKYPSKIEYLEETRSLRSRSSIMSEVKMYYGLYIMNGKYPQLIASIEDLQGN